MQKKLSQWATENPTEQRRELYNLLCNEVWLRVAHHSVNSNQGRETAGIDGQTMSNFNGDLDGNIKRLSEALKAKTFEPAPVRRVYIPKANGKKRPLGIPICPAYCLSLPRRLGMSIARTIAVGWKHQPTQYTGSGSTGTSPTTPAPPSAVAPGVSLAPSAASFTAQEQQGGYERFSGPSFYFYTTKNISVAFYTNIESLRGPAISSWPPEVLPLGGGWPGPSKSSLHPGPMPRLALADGLA
jgi:hypothetical protein